MTEYISIDFDGTVVTHDYPLMGKDVGAVPVLKRLVKNGYLLILNTMRSDDENRQDYPNVLSEAVNWFKQNDIPLYGININPTQQEWTTSPKVYAHLYIDDAALGIPLKYDREKSKRFFVDWIKVEKMLEDLGYFQKEKEIETVNM